MDRNRSQFFRKYMDLNGNEKILVESGFQFRTYKNVLRRSSLVFLLQFLGMMIAVAFTTVAHWMIVAFQAEHVGLGDFSLLVTIFFVALLPCFVIFFFAESIGNGVRLVREHTNFWFSRFVVTSERVVIITPERRRNPFSTRLFVGSVAARDIEDARVVFCDTSKNELQFPKIVVKLKSSAPNMPSTFELAGLENSAEFLSMIQSLAASSQSQTG